jgi:dTDP-4-amino-4,6-dideoxygalactose transaminase
VSQRTLALPFYPGLSSRDVDLVCQTLELMMARIAFARA